MSLLQIFTIQTIKNLRIHLLSIIGWGFCDVWNIQSSGKGLSAEPKAGANNTYRELDYLGYHKKPNLVIIVFCFEENNDKHTSSL